MNVKPAPYIATTFRRIAINSIFRHERKWWKKNSYYCSGLVCKFKTEWIPLNNDKAFFLDDLVVGYLNEKGYV